MKYWQMRLFGWYRRQQVLAGRQIQNAHPCCAKTAISWILILIAVQIIIRFVMDMGEVFNNSYLTIK